MKYLKKIFENENHELMDIFSELELDLPVSIEYYKPTSLVIYEYEAISIVPESKIDLYKIAPRIQSIIEKAENFGYKKLLGQKTKWCLIDAQEDTEDYNPIEIKCNKDDSFENFYKWNWLCDREVEDPKNIIIHCIHIYFET